jgi:hypothetical protein
MRALCAGTGVAGAVSAKASVEDRRGLPGISEGVAFPVAVFLAVARGRFHRRNS